jgi:hypothetical protein
MPAETALLKALVRALLPAKPSNPRKLCNFIAWILELKPTIPGSLQLGAAFQIKLLTNRISLKNLTRSTFRPKLDWVKREPFVKFGVEFFQCQSTGYNINACAAFIGPRRVLE